jgi:hypothetical protein
MSKALAAVSCSGFALVGCTQPASVTAGAPSTSSLPQKEASLIRLGYQKGGLMRIAEVKRAAPKGRNLGFSVSLRPILGETEEKAWERARAILSRIKATRTVVNSDKPPGSPYLVSARPQAVGSQRLLEFAQESEIHDKRL